jgi:hypothetical protein
MHSGMGFWERDYCFPGLRIYLLILVGFVWFAELYDFESFGNKLDLSPGVDHYLFYGDCELRRDA